VRAHTHTHTHTHTHLLYVVCACMCIHTECMKKTRTSECLGISNEQKRKFKYEIYRIYKGIFNDDLGLSVKVKLKIISRST